jgi:hypothetical protein
MLPPDLHEPFTSAEDRTHAASQLVQQHQDLEALQRLATMPPRQWTAEQIRRFPPSMSGHQEHPAGRLTRWQALFADELRQVGDVRDAVAHGRVSDVELRTALYLAGRLLAFAYGDGVHEVDQV